MVLPPVREDAPMPIPPQDRGSILRGTAKTPDVPPPLDFARRTPVAVLIIQV